MQVGTCQLSFVLSPVMTALTHSLRLHITCVYIYIYRGFTSRHRRTLYLQFHKVSRHCSLIQDVEPFVDIKIPPKVPSPSSLTRLVSYSENRLAHRPNRLHPLFIRFCQYLLALDTNLMNLVKDSKVIRW